MTTEHICWSQEVVFFPQTWHSSSLLADVLSSASTGQKPLSLSVDFKQEGMSATLNVYIFALTDHGLMEFVG